MIKVSVIVPVYNAEKYLSKCIDSLLNQSLREAEFIFVDDGSSDNSVKIIKSYMDKDNRIILLNQSNLYAGTARNNGIKRASGEYIIFLDSDDFFELNMLEEMYTKAVADDADVCLCNAVKFDERTGLTETQPHYLRPEFLPEKTPFSADDVSDSIFNLTSPSPWTKLFKTSFILNNGIKFQQVKKSNDFFFIFSNLALAGRITYVNKTFVNYRVGNANSLQGEKQSLSLDFYQAVIGLKKELQKRKIFSKFEKSFVNRAMSVCVYVLKVAKNKQNFLKLAHLMKEQYFFEFSIIGHTRPYFYIKSEFDVLFDVMDLPDDELWNKYHGEKEDNDFPLINIDEWQSEVICQGSSPKVSVIIPVYNSEKYLTECIESVINNTLKDIEIICVNDGSSDNSLKLLEAFCEKDSRISIISKENGGLSSARNAGLAAAAGEYVLFLDSDDYIHEKTLEYLYNEVKKDDLDQLYFSAVSFYDNENIKNNFKTFDSLYRRCADYSAVTSGRKMFADMVNNNEFRPSACLQFNKKAFLDKNKLSFYDGLLHEDNLFTIQCLAFAEKVKHANINLYYRRVHENSIITGESAAARVYSYYKTIKLLEQFAVRNGFACDKEYFESLMYQISVIDFNACDVAESLSEEELAEFALSLKEDEAIDFYNHINAVVRIRLSNKELSKRSKLNAELVKITTYKFQHKINSINAENQQLKNKLAYKPIKFIFKLNALLKRLLRRK